MSNRNSSNNKRNQSDFPSSSRSNKHKKRGHREAVPIATPSRNMNHNTQHSASRSKPYQQRRNSWKDNNKNHDISENHRRTSLNNVAQHATNNRSNSSIQAESEGSSSKQTNPGQSHKRYRDVEFTSDETLNDFRKSQTRRFVHKTYPHVSSNAKNKDNVISILSDDDDEEDEVWPKPPTSKAPFHFDMIESIVKETTPSSSSSNLDRARERRAAFMKAKSDKKTVPSSHSSVPVATASSTSRLQALQSEKQSNVGSSIKTPFNENQPATNRLSTLYEMPPVNIPKPVSSMSSHRPASNKSMRNLWNHKSAPTSSQNYPGVIAAAQKIIQSSSSSNSTTSVNQRNPFSASRNYVVSAAQRGLHSDSDSSPTLNEPARRTKPTMVPINRVRSKEEHEVIELLDDSDNEDVFKSAPSSPAKADDNSNRPSPVSSPKSTIKQRKTEGPSTKKEIPPSRKSRLSPTRLSDYEEYKKESSLSDDEDHKKKRKSCSGGNRNAKDEGVQIKKIRTKHNEESPVDKGNDKKKSGDSDIFTGVLSGFPGSGVIKPILRVFGGTKGTSPKNYTGTPIETPSTIRHSSTSAEASTSKPSPPKPATSLMSTEELEKQHFVYPFSGKKAVVIRNRDMDRLEENKFLNDSIMDVYPKILNDQHPQPSIYTYSSFFFTKLTRGSTGGSDHVDNYGLKIRYEDVKRWTDKTDLFEKKYLIIPIEQRNHWFLAVVAYPGNCAGIQYKDKHNEKEDSHGPQAPIRRPYITFLDSLGGDHDTCFEQICLYLKKEAVARLQLDPKNFKKPIHVKGRPPQQPNLTDCGVYCLYCIKHIYENRDESEDILIRPSVANDHKWKPEGVMGFRGELKSIFEEKADEYKLYEKANPKK